jgi:hypothetical protein
MKKGIMPTTDFDRVLTLDKAAAKAPSYATILNLSPAMVAERVADAAAFHYGMAVLGSIATGSKDWTFYKNLLFNGPDSGAVIPVPLPISFGTAPAAVRAGISARFSNFAAYCKMQPGYTENIGIELGIVGSDQPGPDLNTVQPDFKLTKRPDGILVGWGWQGLANDVNMIELRVDRSDGKGPVALAFDSTPGYLDTMPFPGTLTKWIYTAIYRKGDAQVGLWSNPVSIVVGG